MLIEIKARTGKGTPRSTAEHYATLLDGFYRDLLEAGIPERLAALVRQLDAVTRGLPDGRKLAVVVDLDEIGRAGATALLEETGLSVVECASAEAAMAVLQQRSDETAFLFTDQHLAGRRDGLDLASTVKTLWPGVHVVVTVENEPTELPVPAGAVAMKKPWKGLDLVRQAERALQDRALTDTL